MKLSELITPENVFYIIVYLLLISLIVGVVITLCEVRRIAQLQYTDDLENRLILDEGV